MTKLNDKKFELLWKYEITLIQWPDKRKHWRLWLNRENWEEFKYICEAETIDKCLDMAIEYVSKLKFSKRGKESLINAYEKRLKIRKLRK